MTSTTNPEQTDRLAILEKRVKALEQALMVEKRKTTALQQRIEQEAAEADQIRLSYESAFDQAAKSYEPIIQRALTLSQTAIESAYRETAAIQVDRSLIEGVSGIFKDVPRTLAALALIISLLTGGTSIISLTQSSLAQNLINEVTDRISEVEEDTESAKAEANNARLEAVEAKKEAESAKEDAVEARAETEKIQAEVDKVRTGE